MASADPSPVATGPASAAPIANEPTFRPAAVVKTWPYSDGGTSRWRTANWAARAGPVRERRKRDQAEHQRNAVASGHSSISEPKIA